MRKALWFVQHGLVVLLAVAACGNGAGQPTVGPADTLKIAAVASGPFTQSFNPMLADSGNAVGYATKAIYEPLLQDDFVKGNSRPWLVAAYEWGDGGRTLTLHLAKGAKWSDGTAFTATDVAFSFDLVRRNKAFDLYSLPIASTAAPAPDTAVITFSQPSYQVMWWRQVVVPQAIWSKIADPVKYDGSGSIGTGPYMFKSFTPQVITLVRNPYYWRPSSKPLKTLEYISEDSVESMLAGLEAGQLDWIGSAPLDPKPIARHDATHISYWATKPSNAVVVLLPNDSQFPFNQVAVRRAVSQAIDRKQISQISSLGENPPALSPTGIDAASSPNLLASAYKNLHFAGAQPAAAKQTLQDAGYKLGSDGIFVSPDGKRLSITLTLPSSNPYGDFVKASQVMAGELKQAGIDLQMKTESQVAWRSDTALGNFQMTVRAIGGTLDTYDFYNRIFTQDQLVPTGKSALLNFERYSSADAGGVLHQYALSSPGSAQEAAARDELEKLMVEEAPVIPILYTAAVGFYRSNHATGFPSASDPYAVPVPDSTNVAMVLARIQATGK